MFKAKATTQLLSVNNRWVIFCGAGLLCRTSLFSDSCGCCKFDQHGAHLSNVCRVCDIKGMLSILRDMVCDSDQACLGQTIKPSSAHTIHHNHTYQIQSTPFQPTPSTPLSSHHYCFIDHHYYHHHPTSPSPSSSLPSPSLAIVICRHHCISVVIISIIIAVAFIIIAVSAPCPSTGAGLGFLIGRTCFISFCC